MKGKDKALVLMGDGINCEFETAHALRLAGFNPELIHVSHLIEAPSVLDHCSFLVLPGGFSFGDEIESGKVLAIKLQERVRQRLEKFIDSGRLVLGICNGFQALVQMGLLPESTKDGKNTVSLLSNENHHFINTWVELTVPASSRTSSNGFFEGLNHFQLPIRHGEGRLGVPSALQKDILAHSALVYDNDVNGSFEKIAALKNSRGNVLGMMPHPEAFVRWTHHPAWTSIKLDNPDLFQKEKEGKLPEEEAPQGLRILMNARKMTEVL